MHTVIGDKRPGGPRFRVFVIIPQLDDDHLREAMTRFIEGNVWSQSGPTFEGHWYRPIMQNDPYRNIFKASELPKELQDVSHFVINDHLYDTDPGVDDYSDTPMNLKEALDLYSNFYVHTIYAYANEDCECVYG